MFSAWHMYALSKYSFLLFLYSSYIKGPLFGENRDESGTTLFWGHSLGGELDKEKWAHFSVLPLAHVAPPSPGFLPSWSLSLVLLPCGYVLWILALPKILASAILPFSLCTSPPPDPRLLVTSRTSVHLNADNLTLRPNSMTQPSSLKTCRSS